MLGMFGVKKESCGRYASRPEAKSVKDEVELFEEAVPITQQIENLRTKISLQERYNAALKDNLEESAKGSYEILRNMFSEVYNLRIQVREAVNKERWAVNSALRSHRLFQLALRYTHPSDAVDWMEDKLFDHAKALDNLIDRLIKKRKKLEDTEIQVGYIEKWPIPGSLPWEARIDEKQRQAETAQANVQFKLECARVMRNTYRSIRHRLRLEKDLYAPIIKNLSSQLTSQKHELKNLEEMLGHAVKFQKDAEETLVWTEREASANRKVRRAQIAKMRKEMQKMLEEEQLSFLAAKISRVDEQRTSLTSNQAQGGLLSYHSILETDDAEIQQNERLAKKRAQIDQYNNTAALLVEVMKVPNLIHIPGRMDDVLQLLEILKEEKESKEKLKEILVQQRDQLSQLFCVIRFTGNKELEENNMVTRDYQKTLEELKALIEVDRYSLNKDHSLMCDLQLGVQTLLQRIEGMDKRLNIRNNENIFHLLAILHEKIKVLVDHLKELRTEVVRRRSLIALRAKNQIYFTPPRFMRVGAQMEDLEASDDEEYDDFKVPGSQELKQESEKIYHQGMLRRGFAAARRLQAESRSRRQKSPKPTNEAKNKAKKKGRKNSKEKYEIVNTNLTSYENS